MERRCDRCIQEQGLTVDADWVRAYGPSLALCTAHVRRELDIAQPKPPDRDPKALYCPHCGAEAKQVEVSTPVLAELGSPLQPAGAIVYVAFTCPKCRAIISCSVVSAKPPAARVF